MKLSFLILCFAAACFGQPGPLSCQRIDQPVTVRAEGMAELIGDILLRCTGGVPTTAGALVPKYQVVVTSSVPLTSRILVPGVANAGMSEALLLIDEPAFPQQVGCATPASGESCPAIAGADNPNVFQGRQVQSNTIAFRSVPVSAPGPGQRTLRIANLRANIAALAGGPLAVSIALFDESGASVAIKDASKTLVDPRAGLAFSVRTLTDTPPALKGTSVITIPPGSLPVGAPQALVGFNVKFAEGFVGAFRRRNVGTSSESPLFMTVQAVPGLAYNTESGFLNTLFPTLMKMDTAGLADSGTRLSLKFQNVPKDVLIWVSTRDVRAGTTQYSDLSARAVLTVADARGGGALTPVRPSIIGLTQIPVVNGTATAVWEIVSAHPATLQDVSFSVALSAQTATPGQGAVTAIGGLGPLPGEAAALDMVPQFKSVGVPVPAFSISNLITVPGLNVVSAASFAGPDAAPGSIVSAFGQNLASLSAPAEEAILPTTLAGASVDLIDTTGAKKSASLLFVSPTQINFVVTPELEPGPVLVNVLSGTRLVASGYLQLNPTSPSLFSASGEGTGIVSGEALLSSSGNAISVPVARYDASERKWMGIPINLSRGDLVFLTLYGTGIRGRRSLTEVRASIGGLPVPVTYAGAQGSFAGLDQVNVGPLPASLAGRGLVDLVVSIGSRSSNPVQVQVQ